MKTKIDLIQNYYMNKVAFNRPQNSGLVCSSFFFVSVRVLWTSAGFVLGFDSTSSHFWMKNHKNSLETRFTECAGSRVFGIHTVVYVRRIYDKKRKSFVTQEVKHPYTIYALPDLP